MVEELLEQKMELKRGMKMYQWCDRRREWDTVMPGARCITGIIRKRLT